MSRSGSRKTWIIAAAVAVAVVVGAVIAASGSDRTGPAADNRSVTTATVERGPLSTVVSGAGILTYRARSDGSPLAVINRASGTYTQLPGLGDQIDCGEVIYRVDQHPVLLLCGAVPAYRDLHPGEVGDDVRQLNQNLHLLGADAGIGIDPDDNTFTARTAAALETLQRKNGFGVTGALTVADAVFLPWPLRIAEVAADVGGPAQPGAPVLRATSDTLEVHIELAASEQEAVEAGDQARITLPDNTVTTGRIDRLGRIAKAPEGQGSDAGAATIGAYISLDDPARARSLDKAPVRVEIATKGIDDALSVPVTAIFGRSGGGFAVEVLRDRGPRELIPVELGLFDTAGGRVQVEGGIRRGDQVVVPSS